MIDIVFFLNVASMILDLELRAIVPMICKKDSPRGYGNVFAFRLQMSPRRLSSDTKDLKMVCEVLRVVHKHKLKD